MCRHSAKHLFLMVLTLAMFAATSPPAQSARAAQYKRVHQKALAAITAGKVEDAVAMLEKFAGQFPDDAETQFMLTVAFAQQGKTDQAVASMKKAVELGLPPGRFIAGPRDLLRPLADRPEFQKLLSDNAGKPLHGPMIGAVTDTSARFWVRTARPAEIRIIVDCDDAAKAPGIAARTASARSTAQNDFAAVVEVAGLRPDTRYSYRVEIDGNRSGDGGERYFRTSAARGSKINFTLAFGGGAGYVPEHERMWDTIDKFHPRLLLLLGDNVYSDNPQSPHMQRYCYYRRQSRPEFRRLLAHTPVYSIWDDHDFGTNDCWGGPEIDTPAWKRPVWNVFRQNWVNPAYGGGRQRPGCWYDFSVGAVDFFMLDCRYYRTNPRVDKPSMLGPVQRAWLADRLKASKATFKVICSSVPWDYRTKGTSRDTWNGFHAERDEIFSLLERNKIGGVVLMSADRHRSDAWRIERETAYNLFEFNSSRLTNQHVHPTMKDALFSYNKKQSFGLVTFDTTAADPTVVYKVVTIDGEVVHTLTVRHSRLQ